MASIIEACDNTMKEAFAGIKIFLWAIPICMGLAAGNNVFKILVGIVAAILLLGLGVTTANNIITKKPMLVPGINFLRMSINAMLALVALIPYALIASGLYWATTFINLPNNPIINDTIHITLDLFIAAIPLTALAIFVRRLNPIEALNFKKYFYGFGEVFLSSSYFVVKLALFSLIIIGFLVYIFSLFIGFENSLWTYLLSVIGVFYWIIASNYIAQISDEVYIFPEKEEAKLREQEEINKILTNHE